MRIVASKTPRLLLVATLTLGVLLLQGHKAYAHFPESEGPLTAILHVEPDDYPPATKPETIYFIFSDLSGKFKLADCACNLSISEKGRALYYAPLSLPPAGQPTIYSTSGIPFTFPNQDIYQIKLVGTPLASSDFTPFDLNWNFHVGPSLSSGDSTSLRTTLLYFGLILVALVAIGVVVYILS